MTPEQFLKRASDPVQWLNKARALRQACGHTGLNANTGILRNNHMRQTMKIKFKAFIVDPINCLLFRKDTAGMLGEHRLPSLAPKDDATEEGRNQAYFKCLNSALRNKIT